MALFASDEESIDGCHLCNDKFENPRVLSCLHVFCEQCLKNQINDNDFITCSDCGQITKLCVKGVSALPPDYISCNRIDLNVEATTDIICRSCKSKENAIAHCNECATFLCPKCVTAHQFMRCFESHTVVQFSDLKKDNEGFATIHKPVTCLSHPDEVVKFYCYTCRVPICSECMVLDHKQPEHIYEKAVDAEQKQREELQILINESKNKVNACDEGTSVLENRLADLQMQRDNVKSHIEETFQSYKAMLEKQQDYLLKELEAIHSSQELQLMETSHNAEKVIDKIESACKFAERLLNNGNAMEVLSLIQLVRTQLLSLINNTPKLDSSIGISFETDGKRFEEAIKNTFGCVRKPEPAKKKEEFPLSEKTSPSHSTSSFESEAFSFSTSVASPEDHLPALDVDLVNSFAQFNLAQLAGIAAKNMSPPATDPNTPINFASFLAPTSELDVTAQYNALNNLTALAKMGSIGTAGLNLHSTTSPPLGISSPSPADNIDNFFCSNSIGSSGSRVNSPLNGSLLNGVGGSLLAIANTSSSSTLSPIGAPPYSPAPRSATVKLNVMQIRCKFGQLGSGKSQFSSPHGFCLGVEEEIIVADTNNHRIQVFEKTGDFKYQFGVAGKDEGQLWYPRKVAVVRTTGKFIVCDRGSERSRMQIFTKTGHFLKKIAIRFIDIVAGLAITNEGMIIAVDSVAPTVFLITEDGDLLRWFDCSEHMREPSDVTVSNNEIYICDFKGHCVIVFSDKGEFLRKIGSECVTNFPNGIDISDAGDVLVGDSHGNRFHIVVFSRQGVLLSEFECPYVKVSRCCGLKITSEGYVVTLAKNNHHVLVLNTLYIA